MQVNSIPDPVGGIRTSDDTGYRNRDRDTDEGRAFYGGHAVGGGVGAYASFQLLNPIGSGVIALIDHIHIAFVGTSDLRLQLYDTALANLAKNWPSADIGGTEGEVELRYNAEASILGTDITRSRQTGSRVTDLWLPQPLRVNAGKGILLAAGTTNVNLYVTVAGREL